jgi:hypothetical protein
MSVDKFKGNGTKWLTEGLFLETPRDTDTALYTLQPWDKESNGKLYPSIHKLYVEMMDVAEWEFANKYFGGYDHWLTIKSKDFFKETYAAMVKELNAKIRGMSLKNMMQQAAEGVASQATLKYLADNDYLPKAAVGKASRKKPENNVVSIVQSDLNRIKNK